MSTTWAAPEAGDWSTMSTGFPVALKDDPTDTARVPTYSKDDFTQMFFAAYESRPIPLFWQNLARKKKMATAMDAIYSLYCEIAQEVQTEFRNNKKQDYRLAKVRPGHMALMVALTENCEEKDLTKQKIKRRLKNSMRLTLRSSIAAAETDEQIDSVILTTMTTRMDELLDEKRRVAGMDSKKRRSAELGELSGLGGEPEEPLRKRREVIEYYASQANLARQVLLLAREAHSFPQEKTKEIDERAAEFIHAYMQTLHDDSQSMLKYSSESMESPNMQELQVAQAHQALKVATSAVMNSAGHPNALDISATLPMHYGGIAIPPFRSFNPVPELGARPTGMNPKPNGK